MFKEAVPFFMYCETPLHVGSGTELGVVDLPIQRERHTGFPKVESSGLKGALRECFQKKEEVSLSNKSYTSDKERSYLLYHAFGPESGDKHSGSLGFTDARLLLFPVKSMKGIFAWITCPRVLQKLKAELAYCGKDSANFVVPVEESTPKGCKLFIGNSSKIVLEEYTIDIKSKDNNDCTTIAEWLSDNLFNSNESLKYWREKMKTELVVLKDDDFRDFVEMSTEVVTRIKIDSETGTVKKGHLFTEEYLPAESILYSLVLAAPVFGKEEGKGLFEQDSVSEEKLVLSYFTENIDAVFQLGGNATTGKGLVRGNVLQAGEVK